MTGPIDTKAIRASAEAASKGPWEYQDIDSVGGGRICDPGVEIASIDFDVYPIDTRIHRFRHVEEADRTGEFIAGARTWVPQLCDEVDALRARVSELEAERDKRRLTSPSFIA